MGNSIEIINDVYGSKTYKHFQGKETISPEEMSEIMSEVQSEIISGCNFYQNDLWLYAIVMERTAQILRTQLNDNQKKIYDVFVSDKKEGDKCE